MTDVLIQTDEGIINLDRCAKALRDVAYLPVCEEMREAARAAENPAPTDTEIHEEWTRRQARALLEMVGLIP